MLYMVKLTIDF